jgi:hypothetical protein
MTQTSANTTSTAVTSDAKAANRCTFRFPNGSRCSLSVVDTSTKLCYSHAKLQLQHSDLAGLSEELFPDLPEDQLSRSHDSRTHSRAAFQNRLASRPRPHLSLSRRSHDLRGHLAPPQRHRHRPCQRRSPTQDHFRPTSAASPPQQGKRSRFAGRTFKRAQDVNRPFTDFCKRVPSQHAASGGLATHFCWTCAP